MFYNEKLKYTVIQTGLSSLKEACYRFQKSSYHSNSAVAAVKNKNKPTEHTELLIMDNE